MRTVDRITAGPGFTSRRRLLLATVGSAVGLVLPVAAHADGRVTLVAARSLPDELAAAQRAGQPLVVLVSLHGCPICREARDSHLGPLRDERAVPVVQVDMRSDAPVRDAQGRLVTHDALVRTWGVRVAPTVLFLGAGGRELAPRLDGFSSDFYGAYLDDRMVRSRAALRN